MRQSREPLRVLVTNDDGVHSPGLHELAVTLADQGHDVRVVAPSRDHSGFAAAVGPLHVTGQVEFERLELAGLPGIETIAIDGPPALCVLAIGLGGLGPRPDVVVSGINAGANTGRAVLHSGTVGAAFTANSFGIPGLAVSQALGADYHWATAALVAAGLVPWVVEQREIFTLNVNVPNVAPQPLVAHVAALDTGGEVQTGMYEVERGVLQLRFTPKAPAPGTDSSIVASGCVAITPLTALRPCEIVVEGALESIAAALDGPGERVA